MKYQFSANGTNWHDTMQTMTSTAAILLDGGTTWGTSHQFRGEDGRMEATAGQGSDADVTRANIVKAMLLEAIGEDGLHTTDINGSSAWVSSRRNYYGVLKAIDIEDATTIQPNRVGQLNLEVKAGNFGPDI